MPFQMPQMFSQLSQPSPLKKAYCRLSVLSAVPAVGDVHHVARLQPAEAVDARNEVVLAAYWPQVIRFQASASSEGLPSGLENQRVPDLVRGQ